MAAQAVTRTTSTDPTGRSPTLPASTQELSAPTLHLETGLSRDEELTTVGPEHRPEVLVRSQRIFAEAGAAPATERRDFINNIIDKVFAWGPVSYELRKALSDVLENPACRVGKHFCSLHEVIPTSHYHLVYADIVKNAADHRLQPRTVVRGALERYIRARPFMMMGGEPLSFADKAGFRS